MNIISSRWKIVYLSGAISGLLLILVLFLELIIEVLTGANDATMPDSALDIFAMLREGTLIGLYKLNFIKLISLLLMVPVMMAIYAVHRRVDKAMASVAQVVFIVGAVTFISSNTALPMLDLSNKYITTTDPAQRAVIESAGEAILSIGDVGSSGALVANILPWIGVFLFSIVIKRGGLMGRYAAVTGMSASALLILFVIMLTFFPLASNPARVISLLSEMLMIVFVTIVTYSLFKIISNIKE